MKKVSIIILLIVLLVFSVSPVFAVSYVDLERTTVGSLDDRFALSFDGENDYVEVLANATINDLSEFTWSIWVYYDGYTAYPRLLDKQRKTVNVEASGVVVFKVQASTTSATSITIETLPVNQSTFCIFIFSDSGDRKGYVYFNGVACTYSQQDAATGTLTSEASNNLYVGNNANFIRSFDGIIDEVRIYNRTLNTTEISYSYNSGNGRHTPLNQTGLVLWQHFNEGNGTTTYDETANDNDGTIEGASWVSGKVQSYLPNIPITQLEPSYNVSLYNSSGLWLSAIANSQGIANLTISEKYLDIFPIEGTYRIYDDNATFVYSKWFEDIHGGDEYQVREETSKGFVLATIFLLIFVGAPITALIWRKR